MTIQRQAILQTRAIHFQRRLFFGAARLFATHIEITGWSFRGRVKRNIPLSSIREAAVDGELSDRLLFLRLSGRDAYTRLELARGAALWRVTLVDLIPTIPTTAHHPDGRRAANGYHVDQEPTGTRLRRLGDRGPAIHATNTISLPPSASN